MPTVSGDAPRYNTSRSAWASLQTRDVLWAAISSDSDEIRIDGEVVWAADSAGASLDPLPPLGRDGADVRGDVGGGDVECADLDPGVVSDRGAASPGGDAVSEGDGRTVPEGVVVADDRTAGDAQRERGLDISDDSERRDAELAEYERQLEAMKGQLLEDLAIAQKPIHELAQDLKREREQEVQQKREQEERGRCEQHIEALKCHLRADRIGCHSFEANAFRLVLGTVAYRLMHELRATIQRIAPNVDDAPQVKKKLKWLAKASFETLRLRLLKVAMLVRKTARRLHLQGAASFPLAREYGYVARALG